MSVCCFLSWVLFNCSALLSLLSLCSYVAAVVAGFGPIARDAFFSCPTSRRENFGGLPWREGLIRLPIRLIKPPIILIKPLIRFIKQLIRLIKPPIRRIINVYGNHFHKSVQSDEIVKSSKTIQTEQLEVIENTIKTPSGNLLLLSVFINIMVNAPQFNLM